MIVMNITFGSLLFLGVLLAALPARAQDDQLYIPPQLTVQSLDWDDGKPVFDISNELQPRRLTLLPMIFYDHPGAVDIPARYHTFSGRSAARDYADTNEVAGGVLLSKYRELLDIVGYRMSRDTAARIGLRGGYSAEPGESRAVAATRAAIVRDYLRSVWGIAADRIALPEPQLMCGRDDHVMRQEEARSVRIETESPTLLAPVAYREVYQAVTKLSLRFHLTPYQSPDRIASVAFLIEIEGRVVGNVTIAGSPDSIRYRLDGAWYPRRSSARSPAPTAEALDVVAVVTTVDGGTYRSNVTPIPIRVRRKVSILLGADLVVLPPFAYRESGLDRSHTIAVDSAIARLGSPRRVAVRAWGFTETSELSAVDDGTLAAEYARMRESRAWSATVAEPTHDDWTGPIDRLDDDPVTRLPLEFRNIPDVGEPRRIRGNDALPLDSLSTARARSVLAYIGDSLGIEDVSAEWGDWSVPLQKEYGDILYPEHRCYRRGVTLKVYAGDEIEQAERDYYRNSATFPSIIPIEEEGEVGLPY